MSKTYQGNSIEYKVYGDYALFSDILTRAGGEKFTMQITTYEAIKGITNSIYFKPTFMWVIDKVRVIKPIQTERKGIRTMAYNKNKPDLSYYTYLKDVEYQVMAHIEWNENRPELEEDRIMLKHCSIANRMLQRGGRRSIFLGVSECFGYVEPCKFGEGESFYDNSGRLDYGVTYHGITYPDEAINEDDKGYMTVRFWQPAMVNGVIEFIRPEDCTIKRHIKKMPIKPFDVEQNNFSGIQEFLGGEELELD